MYNSYNESVDFNDILNKKIVRVNGVEGDNMIEFFTECGLRYQMYHNQDCCESVYIESIVGNLQNLIGKTVTLASKETQDDPDASEYGMWTFYKLAGVAMSNPHYYSNEPFVFIDIRWHGSSNGYYGVGVSFYRRNMNKDDQE